MDKTKTNKGIKGWPESERSRQPDLSLKEKLDKACLAVDLTPFDHMIIRPAGYVSFKNISPQKQQIEFLI